MGKLYSVLKMVKENLIFLLKGSVFYARYKGVKVGENCRIYIKAWGSEPFLISIGNNVTVTSGVRFITHDGSTCLIFDKDMQRYQKFSPITVGSNVFIGINTIVMPGVNIGSNVVVGAGSIITKDIPSNSVVVGSPAKVVSTFEAYKQKIQSTCASNSDLQHLHCSYEDRVFHAIKIQESKSK